jgi:hypothetical protein
MLCRICAQLEEALAKSQQPDSPDILSGLNEAGIRNRILQKQEKARKAELDLEKHRHSCQKRADSAAF